MIKKYITILILIIIGVELCGQNINIDAKLIKSKEKSNIPTYYDEAYGNNSKIMKTKNSFVVKYNPITLVLKGLMFGYQNSISPQLLSICQYELTCSNFGKLAISKYGIIKGVFLTSDRLMRDNLYSISEWPDFNISNNDKALDNIDYYKIK